MSKKHNIDFRMSNKFANFVAKDYADRINKTIKYIDENYLYYFNRLNSPFDERFLADIVTLENILRGKDNDKN